MPYYTRPKHVVHFTYRDFEIDIFKAYRGATHCDLDHKPRTKVCEACGEPIVPELVFLIEIDGSKPGVDCASAEEAEEIARAIIDDQLEGHDDDDDDEDDGTDRSEGNEHGKGNKLILPPPPPPEPRSGIPNNIVHQMKKLGWIQRAMSIISQHPKR